MPVPDNHTRTSPAQVSLNAVQPCAHLQELLPENAGIDSRSAMNDSRCSFQFDFALDGLRSCTRSCLKGALAASREIATAVAGSTERIVAKVSSFRDDIYIAGLRHVRQCL